MTRYQVGDIKSRLLIPMLLHERDLLGIGVEVGTHRGEFANHILTHWRGKQLVGVDPYFQEYADGRDPVTQGNRVEDEQLALTLLSKYGNRFSQLRMPSVESCSKFGRSSLDFVYVDGDHTRDAVYEDLINWWSKIKPGGLLCGHDVMTRNESDGWGQEIQEAIQLFYKEVEHPGPVYLIPEPLDSPWSYYIVKQ